MFIEKCHFDEILYDRSGSLIVDYDVITNDEPTSASTVVSVAKDLVSGTENVTYDGKSAPVSLAAFRDSSGTNGR